MRSNEGRTTVFVRGNFMFILAFGLSALMNSAVDGQTAKRAVGHRTDSSFIHRPVVILVHGRSNAFASRETMLREWREALAEGLQRAGADGLLTNDDVRLVYYGNVYAPGYVPSNYCEHLPVSERAGLTGLAAERAREEDAWDDVEPIRASLWDQLVNGATKALARVASPNLALIFLDDVRAYLKKRVQFC